MMQFLIAAPSSGSGKTTVACAVLAALKKRGADPCAFKSGPDYIDPMFHRSALQVDSHNLDLFLSNRDMVRAIFARYAAGHGAAVCKGAMGFYDGQGLTTRASAWELADTLGLPVLLVVQPKGASVTLAAQIQGLVNFRKNSHVSGILLNDCSEKLYKMLKALLERETGLPVLGYLPHLPQAAVESRHLGLKTADEIADLQEKIALLADALVLDWQRLAVLTEKPAPEALPGAAAPTSVRIAVAKDEAFCFTYAETVSRGYCRPSAPHRTSRRRGAEGRHRLGVPASPFVSTAAAAPSPNRMQVVRSSQFRRRVKASEPTSRTLAPGFPARMLFATSRP